MKILKTNVLNVADVFPVIRIFRKKRLFVRFVELYKHPIIK